VNLSLRESSHLSGKENEGISLAAGDETSLREKKIKGRRENYIWLSMKNHNVISAWDY
jgi:hypothetical protein